jgi:hypothetical protein
LEVRATRCPISKAGRTGQWARWERVYKRIQEDEQTLLKDDEKDALVDWFCGAFEDQFDRDEVYDNYPVDDLLKDIFALYIAVLNMGTKVLTDFPIPAMTTEKRPKK